MKRHSKVVEEQAPSPPLLPPFCTMSRFIGPPSPPPLSYPPPSPPIDCPTIPSTFTNVSFHANPQEREGVAEEKKEEDEQEEEANTVEVGQFLFEDELKSDHRKRQQQGTEALSRFSSFFVPPLLRTRSISFFKPLANVGPYGARSLFGPPPAAMRLTSHQRHEKCDTVSLRSPLAQDAQFWRANIDAFLRQLHIANDRIFDITRRYFDDSTHRYRFWLLLSSILQEIYTVAIYEEEKKTDGDGKTTTVLLVRELIDGHPTLGFAQKRFENQFKNNEIQWLYFGSSSTRTAAAAAAAATADETWSNSAFE